jgi:predicted Zn-dependent protease with MMP-like domain
MPPATRTYAPDTAALERLADAALARLPEHFGRCSAMWCSAWWRRRRMRCWQSWSWNLPYELTGLYSGRSLREGSAWASGELPPMIHLYRRALLLEWVETAVALEDLITHVIVHEVGHHFGLSDEDMHALEEQA